MSSIAIGVGALAGVGGSIYSGISQSDAAQSAQRLEAENQKAALQFQEQEWQQQQQNMAPWITSGQGAVTRLSDLMNQSLGGGGPLAPWTQQFTAPTLAQAEQEPGYKFALEQGRNALTNSAAASGNLLTGNTGEALEQYGQNLGEENYQNVYDRAMRQYMLGYNQYEQNQSNLFNRYASLAGLGQTSAATLGNQGQAAASNFGNISLTGAGMQAQQINNAAYQQASGYLGGINAFNSGIGNLMQYQMLQNMGYL